MSLLFAVGLATAPGATAATCDNATLLAQNNSTALPDCRAYEMVSAPYKQGFPVQASAYIRFTDDGVVSYRSTGAFAGNVMGSPGNLYHATRSAAGWVTSSMDPPGSIYETSLGETAVGVFAESDDLRWSLWRMYRHADETAADVGFWLRGPDGVFTRLGDGLFTGGGSAGDLSHVIVGLGNLSEYVSTGNDNDGPPRSVSVNNNGQQLGAACAREMSPDGRVIVFGVGCVGGTDSQLWARVGGSATVAVSGSECTRPSGDPNGACNAASGVVYAGAADDGSRVFITTSQQLVNGDIDQTNDLYACDIPAGEPAPVGATNPCDTLMQVSGVATDAQVRSVHAVSVDGSRVYFVAQGVLADNLGAGGVGARAGADNLYLWERDNAHPAGQTRYVTRLAHAENLNSPASGDDLRAQVTPDGRYLLFTTANRLVASGAGAETAADEARDVYRYDAVTHRLVRVSTSITGGGGNTSGFDASLPGGSAMSDDGSTVVFDTVEALSVSDTDGVTDVYSWRDGQVSLISVGGGTALGVTSSGRDIFFRTAAQVLAADSDLNADIYTARLGGGFARPQPTACSGDGCQDLLSGAPGLAGPRSGLSGDDNPGDAATVLSLRAVTSAQWRRLVATGKLSLTVAANTTGRVTATARAKIDGRSVTVGSARRTMTRPGSVAVTLKLSPKARRQLARRGRLTVKVVVSHSKAMRGRSVTLRLTRARATQSSVGGRS